MSTTAAILKRSTVTRARESRGDSSDAVHAMVRRALQRRLTSRGGTLLDVGCGRGGLRAHVQDLIDNYSGIDVVRYDGFPSDARFYLADLDAHDWPVPALAADVVAAVETIEHLENPRAFVRQLARICRRDGLIVITTPNQLSLLSKLTLVLKNEFNAFQEAPGLYPAHRTALLECDLHRIAREANLQDAQIEYSDSGRVPGMSRNWPAWRCFRGRAWSDNVLLSARKT